MNRREFLKTLGISAAVSSTALMSSCSNSKGSKLSQMAGIAQGNNAELYPVFDGDQYILKNFSHLTKDTNLGLSPEIINNHLNLYKKYIEKVNAAEKKMRTVRSTDDIDDLNLKNLAFSLNGMALHDIYFTNMNSQSKQRSAALTKAIEENFGSFETYMNNLVAIARKVKGWSITAVNLLNGKLINYGLEDHSANFPNFVVPILALDVYTHAYEMDFGLDGKDQYLQIFQRIIDWDIVSRRFDAL